MVGYYECATAAATAAKTVTASWFTLRVGGSMKIKMTYANTAASGVTLNINSTGAKPLYYDGSAVSASNTWKAGETVEVYYDGTNFYANNVAGGGVYDISAHHGGATYADLAAALGTNGANVPEDKREGGMMVRFVMSSDNKYHQYRLMSKDWSTYAADWISDEKTAALAHKDEYSMYTSPALAGHIFKNVDGLIINSQGIIEAGESNNRIILFENTFQKGEIIHFSGVATVSKITILRGAEYLAGVTVSL
jgi:hypothetical protein